MGEVVKDSEQRHNPLWEYSLAVYAREGVADCCLALQDEFGLDVNLLLYAAWLAQRGERLQRDHLAGLEARVARWREKVVKPLRQLRRQWRDESGAGSLRRDIKALELRAERLQQDEMYAFHSAAAALPQGEASLKLNLAQVAGFCSPDRDEWDATIDGLVALLAQ